MALAHLLLAGLVALPADLPADAPGRVVDPIPTAADPSESYALYLPSTFEPTKRWPAILVFDPRRNGRRGAERFAPAAERFGWIVVSANGTMSDGPWEPNRRAVLALWPELARYPIDPSRLYAAGFSGGSIVAWFVGQGTGKLAGVISCGGRPEGTLPLSPVRFDHYGLVGDLDFNYHQMKALDRLAEESGRAHRLTVFPGLHEWPSTDRLDAALGWLELQAMRRGLRPRDERLVNELWSTDVKEADRLEAAGDVVAAVERYRAIARSFEGLRATAQLGARADLLEQREGYRSARDEEARLEEWEREVVASRFSLFGRIRRGEERPTAKAILAEIGAVELLEMSTGKGPDARVAARLVQRMLSQLGFYLPRDLVAAGRPEEAEETLRAALVLAPDRIDIWSRLADAARASADEPAAPVEEEQARHLTGQR